MLFYCIINEDIRGTVTCPRLYYNKEWVCLGMVLWCVHCACCAKVCSIVALPIPKKVNSPARTRLCVCVSAYVYSNVMFNTCVCIHVVCLSVATTPKKM